MVRIYTQCSQTAAGADLHRTQRNCKSAVTGRFGRQYINCFRKRTFTQQCLRWCLDMDIHGLGELQQ